MKQQCKLSRGMLLSIRAPNCLKAYSLSPLLAGGVFIIAGLSMPVASATALTEAAALLNIQSSGEMKSLVRDAAKLLQNYDGKSDMPSKDGVLRQQQSTGVDDGVIPFLSNLVESIAHGKAPHKKVAVKSEPEPIVIRRIVKVNKLPVVKHWAGLNRTHPALSYAKANALLKKAAVAKSPAVLQILPKIADEKKAYVQYPIK